MALSLNHLRRAHVELDAKPEVIAAREREERIRKRKETIAKQREEKEQQRNGRENFVSRRRGVVDVHKVYTFLNTNKDEIAYIEKLEIQKEAKRKEKKEKELGNQMETEKKDDDRKEKKKNRKKNKKKDQEQGFDEESSEKAKRADRIFVHGVDVTDIRRQLDERMEELRRRQIILENGGFKRHHLNVREMEDYIPVVEEDEYDELDDNLHGKTSIAYHPKQSSDSKSSAYINPKLAAKIKSKFDEGTVENHEYVLYEHYVPRRHTLGRDCDVIFPLRGYPSTMKPFEQAKVDQHCYDDDPMWVDPLALQKERVAKAKAKAKDKCFSTETKANLKKSFGKNQPISCDSLLFKIHNIEVIDPSKYIRSNEISSMQYDISFNDWSEHHRAGDLAEIDGKIKGELNVDLLVSSRDLTDHRIHVKLYKSYFDGSRILGEAKVETFELLKAGYHKPTFVEASTVPSSSATPSLNIIIECKLLPDKKRKKNLRLPVHVPIFADGSVSGKFPTVPRSHNNSVVGEETVEGNQEGTILGGDSLADSLSEVTGGDNKSEKTKEDLRWRLKVDRAELNAEPAALKSKKNFSMFKEHGQVYDRRHKVYADPITGKERKFYSLKSKIFS